MSEPLRKILELNETLSVRDNLYCQENLKATSLFENLYLALRQKEKRLYIDEIAKELPDISAGHLHQKEWAIRKTSATRLITYLKKRVPHNILELGCGNGWLSSMLVKALTSDVCGMDVNEVELRQATRIFSHDRLTFIKGDIKENLFPSKTFDVIIMASSIQYFEDPSELLKKLMTMLTLNGEIHILDSPICLSKGESLRKKKMSDKYFSSLDLPRMTEHYFYHTLSDFRKFELHKIVSQKSWTSHFRKYVMNVPVSPFPWIKIVNTKQSTK